MKNKIVNKRQNAGITLIALIITIIVLLILVGVSIATLTGENGILKQAQIAKEATEEASAEEQVKLAVYASFDNKDKLDIEKLENELKKIGGNVTKTEKGFPVTVTVDGYTFKMDEKGNIVSQGGENKPNPPKEETGITAADIAKASNKSEYYGAIVTGYTCTNSEGVNAWKIFYTDESNIYLIADDYISSTYAPKGKGGTLLNQGVTDYFLYFTDVISDYAGSSDIKEVRIKALNNNYFNTKGYSSTENNMKAVAYILDTNVWSIFKNSTYADYAIGGPTVEMLMKSYSEKHNVDYIAQASSSTGYQVSKDKGVTWADYYSGMLDTNDSLYVISSYEKANAMWVASPSALHPNHVIATHYSGDLTRFHYSDPGIGFRPLVCLNSNVRLEKKTDGTYEIK